MKKILVTGGAGFIGSNFLLECFKNPSISTICLDKLTYAGNTDGLFNNHFSSNHRFVEGDICKAETVADILTEFSPETIIHFAAESHVDRSIYDPWPFIHTNIVGASTLLKESLNYWQKLSHFQADKFKFIYISTDEVYGSLEEKDHPFTENSPFQPNSPYAASKAGADHFVRAYYHTYGMPTIIIRASNNYGPRQFPEKLIPLIINNALRNKPLPIYGNGKNIRDWLYVGDHCAAIFKIIDMGKIGAAYNIGGNSEKSNINVVETICKLLDEIKPCLSGKSYSHLIDFIPDRPGHDKRYSLDTTYAENELSWKPSETFESGLRKTVQWYINNFAWTENILNGSYQEWVKKHYIGIRK